MCSHLQARQHRRPRADHAGRGAHHELRAERDGHAGGAQVPHERGDTLGGAGEEEQCAMPAADGDDGDGGEDADPAHGVDEPASGASEGGVRAERVRRVYERSECSPAYERDAVGPMHFWRVRDKASRGGASG